MSTEPTEDDIYSPEFNAIWQAIKDWDIQRTPGEYELIAGATGTDVMTILNALRDIKPRRIRWDRILLQLVFIDSSYIWRILHNTKRTDR